MRPWVVGVGLVPLLAGLLVAANSFTTMTYFCSECASERRDLRVIPFGLGTVGKFRGRPAPTEFTTMVAAVDRRPCAHLWVFANGSGGAYACLLGAEGRRVRLREVQASGMLGSALAVDPEGGVELIRWILRGNLPCELFKEEVQFSSRRAFRTWFDELRKKVTAARTGGS